YKTFIQYIHWITKRIVRNCIIEIVIKICVMGSFYNPFIISRISLYPFFRIFFLIFYFFPIILDCLAIYIYFFSIILFITQNITHKIFSFIKYYGHSAVTFSPFSSNLKALALLFCIKARKKTFSF